MPNGDGQGDYTRLLDPEALAKVHRLELIARGVVEGLVAGRHRSPYKGFSVEFAEHRQYVPGDDTRDLDWRVYGKSDRYYIKQYVEETNLRATILLDASGSMKYTGTRASRSGGKRLGKFEYAQYLSACLAHLMIHQQDAVGLAVFDTRLRQFMPPKSKRKHLYDILAVLARTRPEGRTGLAEALTEVARRVRKRGLMILFSDLLADPEPVIDALHHLRFRGHDLIIFQVLDASEVAFPFTGQVRFEDPETVSYTHLTLPTN